MRPTHGGKRYGARLASVGAMLAVLVATLLVSACSQSDVTPDAHVLLLAARDKFNAANSFHFIEKSENLGTPPADVPNVDNVEGDVVRPDKLSATGFVTYQGLGINTKIIIVGDQAWYQIPLLGYQEEDGYADFMQIFDKDKGVGNLLVILQNPTIPVSSKANGVDCWKIDGTVDTSVVSAFLGDDTADSPSVKVSVCIGKDDNQLYSTVLTGAILQGDKDNTVRTIYLSKYGETVTIAPPTE